MQEPIEDADKYKSINAITVNASVNQLCSIVRKQIEDIEYFILKVKSYFAQMKAGGQNEDDRKSCENRMVTAERRICTQLMFLSRVCIHLGNSLLPLGQCMDNFMKLLTQFYVCLANLTKHFINRNKTLPISYKSTKFDQLVQSIGKKLPLKVYAMISYIEDNIFNDENESADDEDKRTRKKDAKNHKAKVMRDTKNIPKLILRIENFNKFVISLSKKTEHDLNKCLHMGTVCDFRITSSTLREAIDKIRENNSSDEKSSIEDDCISDSDDEGSEETEKESDATPVTENGSVCSPNAGSGSGSGSGSIINEVQHNTSLRTSVMKNMNAINKRVNKRKKQDIDNIDDADSNNQNKKKRKQNDSTHTVTAAASNIRRSNRRNTSK